MAQELTLLERADRATFAPGGALRPLIPQTFSDIWTLSEIIVAAGMAPKGYDAPKCTIAIMQGMEIGLTPMAALQTIAVVNGRPTIWGDGALALVRSSGLCSFFKEQIIGAGDDAKAQCEMHRKGEETPIIREFSWADAKVAGLAGKDGPWKQYPKRMMAMRARAWAMRDGFADVFKGLSMREEVEDFDQRPVRDTAPVDVGAKLRRGRAAAAATIDHQENEHGQTVSREEPKGGQTSEARAETSKPVAQAAPVHRDAEQAGDAQEDRRFPDGSVEPLDDGAMGDVPQDFGDGEDGDADSGDDDRRDGSDQPKPGSDPTGDDTFPGDRPRDSNSSASGGAAAVQGSGAAVSSGEVAVPAPAEPQAASTEQAGPAIPPGDWSKPEARLLGNIVRELAKATNAVEVRDVADGYRGPVSLKGPEFQAVANKLIDDKAATFRNPAASTRSRL